MISLLLSKLNTAYFGFCASHYYKLHFFSLNLSSKFFQILKGITVPLGLNEANHFFHIYGIPEHIHAYDPSCTHTHADRKFYEEN